MKMRVTLFLAGIIMWSCSIFAQSHLKDNQKLGYIIDHEGNKTEVVIEVEDASFPWAFQYDLKYFDPSLLDGTRVKRELKKELYAEEFVEYGFDDRRFLAVNYYIKDKGEDIFQSTLGKIKGDKNTAYFAEIVHSGPIQLLRFYFPPQPDDEEDMYDEAKLKEFIKASASNYDILIYKQGQEIKPIQEINVKTYFTDCPFVLKKFDENRYKLKPKSGLKKVLGGDGLSGLKLENASMTVIRDYENKCGGK